MVKPIDYVIRTSQFSAPMYFFGSSENILGRANVEQHIWVELKSRNKNLGRAEVQQQKILSSQSIVERLRPAKSYHWLFESTMVFSYHFSVEHGPFVTRGLNLGCPVLGNEIRLGFRFA